MKTIKIKDKEYKLEYSFEAACHKDLINMLFKIRAGVYFIGDDNKNNLVNMFNGASEMVSDYPYICKLGFYAGLKENHEEITIEESNVLLKAYMKENGLSFKGMFEKINACMEEDGFFDLCGLTEIIDEGMFGENKETEEKSSKTIELKDHKKKTTKASQK